MKTNLETQPPTQKRGLMRKALFTSIPPNLLWIVAVAQPSHSASPALNHSTTYDSSSLRPGINQHQEPSHPTPKTIQKRPFSRWNVPEPGKNPSHPIIPFPATTQPIVSLHIKPQIDKKRPEYG